MTIAVRQRPPGLVSCDECATPAYRIVGETIIIEHVHHGQKHVTVLTISVLLDKIQGLHSQ